jgi:hypothetical protein
MLPEIMWQAWVNNHSDTVFNASWTAYAASAIVSKARGRLAAVGHVELDSVGDVSHTNTPIISEIHTAFGLCVTNSLGIDFYDHSWARTNQYPDDPFFAGPVISNVVRGAP